MQSSEDETPEEKDHFVAQLYKFMDDSNTPLNKSPMIGNKDVDLHKLFDVVRKLGGYNRVTNKNKWRSVTLRLKLPNNLSTHNQVKVVYKKCLLSYEAFHRTLGVTMLNHPRNAKKSRGRSLIRDKDRNTPVNSPRPEKEEDVVLPEKKEEEKPPEEKPKPVPKKAETKPKVEEEKKVKDIVLADVSDTNSSDATDILEVTANVSVRLRRTESKASRERKPKPAAGEKVKALVEKFEEHAKKEEREEEKQQTRSKSQTPKIKEKEVPPEKRSRESKTPVRETPSPSKALTKSVKKVEDDKKRGRKRVNTEEKDKLSDSTIIESSFINPVVGIGDKLKVFYGPTNESKVTYEAKVIEIDKEAVSPMYLVHYTGWNTRYDEWITPVRIAENLSATTKAKKLKSGATSSKVATPKSLSKRGRRMSITGRSSSQDVPPRSTTPSSVTSTSSRTKSPATPVARGFRTTRLGEVSRRTRRTSGQTDISNHSESESDGGTESDSEMVKTRSGVKAEDVENRLLKKKAVKSALLLASARQCAITDNDPGP
ncbi:AT-rich interactive domain-containing protein 4B-like [Photinus pyralis]|uniref:AT-rich interactive domain-containing protein 4B-like n=1 Tax=Photinus pyralis TaxID=7054 RepID=UPI00126740C1|nr:AT-rich interactive domain-containing protein 4B-like [Photinus pyralis]